jgi:NAD(P)-dependent dehydrogenase (short-subunit alcohol dehydrogenase family)
MATDTEAGLTGQVALITGGSRGQGRAHAVEMARAGADVVILDIAEQIASVAYPLGTIDELHETAKLVVAEGRQCLALKADTRSTHDMTDVAKRIIAEFGRIDILIAQAAICASPRLPKYPIMSGPT